MFQERWELLPSQKSRAEKKSARAFCLVTSAAMNDRGKTPWPKLMRLPARPGQLSNDY